MSNLFKAKKKMENIDGDPLVDPSSTPISKYKNRRRIMTMNQANHSSSTLDNKSSFLSNTGSMIGSTIDKLKNKNPNQDSFA